MTSTTFLDFLTPSLCPNSGLSEGYTLSLSTFFGGTVTPLPLTADIIYTSSLSHCIRENAGNPNGGGDQVRRGDPEGVVNLSNLGDGVCGKVQGEEEH